MPLHVVAEIADVDTTVLLGGVADVLHHGLLVLGALFECTRWWRCPVIVRGAVSPRFVVAVGGRTVSMLAPGVVTAGGAGTVAVTTRRTGSTTLLLVSDPWRLLLLGHVCAIVLPPRRRWHLRHAGGKLIRHGCGKQVQVKDQSGVDIQSLPRLVVRTGLQDITTNRIPVYPPSKSPCLIRNARASLIRTRP